MQVVQRQLRVSTRTVHSGLNRHLVTGGAVFNDKVGTRHREHEVLGRNRGIKFNQLYIAYGVDTPVLAVTGDVIAVSSIQDVTARTPNQGVVARAPIERVVSIPTIKYIHIVAAKQSVVPIPTVQQVGSTPDIQAIVTSSASKGVVALRV